MESMKKGRPFGVAAGVVLAALLLTSGPAAAAPPLPGAIFTTTVNGTFVNRNIYADKCDVYLDGGPGPNAPQGAAGLPDGDYYFQVTDPSGKVLLSTDPVENRRFTVTNGVISNSLGTHGTGVDVDHGALTIQLCPYNDTPNNGGEYKVWVTPVGDFVGDPSLVDTGYSPGYYHGFIPAASKTDNFKVRARAAVCLTIIKFNDVNGNGRFDSDEPQIQWPVVVFDPSGAEVQGVNFTGDPWSKFPVLQICSLPSGTYRVVEGQVANWRVTANIIDNKYQTPPSTELLVTLRNQDVVVIFGNTEEKKY